MTAVTKMTVHASHLVRSTMARATARRHLAIAATVKTTLDTSATKFSAPSHVSLASLGAEIAGQLSAFYSNPDSIIRLSEEDRQIVQNDIERKIKTVPDFDVGQIPEIPLETRLGDNPMFSAYRNRREKKKLN